MKLCMFHPVDHPMERGWVGRIEGEHVIQLAAQTLQSFFTGGGAAREHAVYPLDSVQLLAPVLHPPAVRVFEHETSFEFANPAAVVGPEEEVGGDSLPLDLRPRLAAVIGDAGAIAGFTGFADWRAGDTARPKDRDFAIGLGPVVVTRDEVDGNGVVAVVRVDDGEVLRAGLEGFDWAAARSIAADRTTLYAGDILASPAMGVVERIAPASVVDIDLTGIGSLGQIVGARA